MCRLSELTMLLGNEDMVLLHLQTSAYLLLAFLAALTTSCFQTLRTLRSEERCGSPPSLVLLCKLGSWNY